MKFSPITTTALIFTLIICTGAFAEENRRDWIPPVGIPEPSFGIYESHWMYSDSDGYSDAGSGPYSIYVDNTSTNCDDRGPANHMYPRCTLPGVLPTPGTVVEVRGGPYELTHGALLIEANGTADQPIFVRGVQSDNGFPLIRRVNKATIRGTYLIVENLVFDDTMIRSHNDTTPLFGRRFIAFRNNEIRNHRYKNAAELSGEHIVFANNHVHHNQGDDRHGTTVLPKSRHIWILDNYYHHNGGDAIQLCHRCKASPPAFVYIGRNTMHSDRENGVDLKYVDRVVVSQNEIHSYKAAKKDSEWCFDDQSSCGTFSSGSDGSAIVVGSDGAPENPWILCNRIYDSTHGIRIEEVYGGWLVGNSIHRIEKRGIALEKHGAPLYVIGNTIHDTAVGIDQFWREDFQLHIYGNIFSLNNTAAFSFGRRVSQSSVLKQNTFWNDKNPIHVRWNKRDTTVKKSRSLNSLVRGEANAVADPRLSFDISGSLHVDDISNLSIDGNNYLADLNREYQEQFGTNATILNESDTIACSSTNVRNTSN